MFAVINLLIIHAKRVIIQQRDIQLLNKLRFTMIEQDTFKNNNIDISIYFFKL